ncbi:MFS transporter [Kineococcus auxinigenes]|uniref:MFS transporter n=1 Tax=unclassified Kineococcus TaxID=2621656 RepID=UPI003D7DEA51
MDTAVSPGAGTGRAQQREARLLWAAALLNGPAELVDFVLPLWAGAVLGAGPAAVGALVALELVVSVLLRPAAGVLADARERRTVAAAGALLYALSCAGYALAPALPVAFAAAVLGGAGGALFWVPVRAAVAERLEQDPGVYPRLVSWEETGSWVAFVGGLSLLPALGERGLFAGCAVACAVAAAALLTAPRRAPGAPVGESGPAARALVRRLRPVLVAVAATSTAEAAVSVLLLLHLQRGFGLGIVGAALVFLPGAVVMGALPGPLGRLVLRHGRRRVLVGGSLASAAFAASLAVAPSPPVLAVLWVLSAAAYAAVVPVQQAVVAEASGAGTGRGLGLYEAAALLGGAVGAAAAGVLYQGASWAVGCLVAALVLAAGAVVVPRAVRALGVADRPAVPVPGGAPPAAPRGAAAAVPPVAPDPAPAPGAQAPVRPVKTPAQRLRELAQHVALVAVVQVVLVLVDLSWLADRLTGQRRDLDGAAALVHGAGRVWLFVLAVDVVWTLVTVVRARGRDAARSSAARDVL